MIWGQIKVLSVELFLRSHVEHAGHYVSCQVTCLAGGGHMLASMTMDLRLQYDIAEKFSFSKCRRVFKIDWVGSSLVLNTLRVAKE